MNRRQILISAVVIGIVILLVRPEILGSLFALVFLGMIPGTNFTLPFWLMLLAYGAAIFIVIRWLAHQPMYVGNMSRQEKTARALARKKVLAKKTTPNRKTTRRAKRPARA